MLESSKEVDTMTDLRKLSTLEILEKNKVCTLKLDISFMVISMLAPWLLSS